MQAVATPTPLVYLNVRSRAGQALLVEHEFTSGLNLTVQPDDQRLLIALGEISGSQRPLSVKQVSLAGSLLVLWLSDQEWLVIPQADQRDDLEQALYQEFGDEICLELIPDGTFHVSLSRSAWTRVASAAGLAQDVPPQHGGICVHPWTKLCTYDLLISQADTKLLHEWLQPRDQ